MTVSDSDSALHIRDIRRDDVLCTIAWNGDICLQVKSDGRLGRLDIDKLLLALEDPIAADYRIPPETIRALVLRIQELERRSQCDAEPKNENTQETIEINHAQFNKS